MANLILWRHAEAEDSSSSGLDVDRALTKRGQKDAKKMANWLHQHLPWNVEILCSPAKRCVQTATALYNLNPLEIKVVDFLSAESTLARITKEIINDDSSKTCLLYTSVILADNGDYPLKSLSSEEVRYHFDKPEYAEPKGA